MDADATTTGHAAEPRTALLSIQVGDAEARWPIEQLIHDLEHRVHDQAVAHYGRRSGCHYTAWSRGESEHDRADFAAFLADHPERDRFLREFDEASRPVAVAHWWLAS